MKTKKPSTRLSKKEGETMQVPKIIESQQRRLEEMLEQDDSPYLNVQEVGKFLGTDPDCIRASAEGGKCPFAFGGRNGVRGARFTKIPKLAFYNWITQGAMYKER